MKPILFNTDMVKAILAGRKTVTRRVAFPNRDLREFPRPDNPDAWWFRGMAYRNWGFAMYSVQGVMELCRFRPGDILYVRETWADIPETAPGNIHFKADATEADLEWFREEGWKWRPSIHMPKRIARIFLRVTDVRVERLQDITTDGAIAEGAETDDYLDMVEEAGAVGLPTYTLREYFGHYIWDRTLNSLGALECYGWDSNPWVWVIEFERCEKPEEDKP